MATQYPYTPSQGQLVTVLKRFRSTFPPTVDAATLKRLSIASANESYVISCLRFLGFIDQDGKRVEDATKHFYGSDDDFAKGMEQTLKSSYAALFADRGDDVWSATRDDLSTWFRVVDKTSDLVGNRQANTFLTLAALGGHGDPHAAATTSAPKANGKRQPKKDSPAEPASAEKAKQAETVSAKNTPPPKQDVGFAVRIEVNVPAGATATEYDAIFASIRKHLINGA